MIATLLQAWAESPVEIVPTMLMALAAVGWMRGSTKPLTESDALELITACSMLNAVALTYWCVARDDARAFVDWALHALVCGGACFLLSVPRLTQRRGAIATLGPAAGYIGVALLITVFSAAT